MKKKMSQYKDLHSRDAKIPRMCTKKSKASIPNIFREDKNGEQYASISSMLLTNKIFELQQICS